MNKILFVLAAALVPLAALAQTPQPSPTASPSPSVFPTPLVLPPDAVPKILAVTVNAQVFHSGDIISSRVITSTNVAAVELRVAGRAIRFPRVDFGVWQLNYRLPHVPRRFLHDYRAQLVAMNTAGVTAVREVTIALR